jgi:murein DD-endopeptidase MepM/ murein hydrolase activator NlpD
MALGELFKCPITAKWRLSSPYGNRADPFTGVKKFHTGMDMAAPTGTPVKAALDGKVVAVSFNQVYGNYVIISHINGYQSLYAHLHTATAKVGQRINQGDKLGLVGSTGYSTGPHLHFTVYKNGKLVNPQELIK